ncbi:hypothetical protein DAEQUDRAFT_725088, partial [Daedalea quercina L-15889]
MSTAAVLVPAADVLATQGLYTSNYCAAAAAALLLYEYVITLGQESRFVWSNACTGYAVIFLINRLNMLCMSISMFLGLCMRQTIVSCKAGIILWQFSWVNVLFLWAGVSTLRVYAITNRNVLLTAVTAVLASTPVVVNIIANTKSNFSLESTGLWTLCAHNADLSAQTSFMFTILSRVAPIASDVVVLLVTWRKLGGSSRQGRTYSALVILVLRDSTLYFLIFTLLNVIQLVIQIRFGTLFNPLPIFIEAVTCVMISRLILNLRRLVYGRRLLMRSQMDVTIPTVDISQSFFPSTVAFRQHTVIQYSHSSQQSSPLPAHRQEDGQENELLDIAPDAIKEVIDADEEEWM